jgi:hypothetical protein
VFLQDDKNMSFKDQFIKFISGLAPVRSEWQFVTSAGGSLVIETPIIHVGVNATGGGLWIQNTKTNTTATLKYGGIGGSVGVGLIPCPFDFSFSIPQFPSAGVIYKLPYAGRSLSLDELKGPFVMLEVSGDVGPGLSGALMFIGGSSFLANIAGTVSGGALRIPALLATSCAVVRFGGLTASVIPVSAGVSVYVGAVV